MLKSTEEPQLPDLEPDTDSTDSADFVALHMSEFNDRLAALEAALAARPLAGPALGGPMGATTFDHHLDRGQATELYLAWQENFDNGPLRFKPGGQEIAFLGWYHQFTDQGTRAHLLQIRTAVATLTKEFNATIATAVLKNRIDIEEPSEVLDFIGKWRTAHPNQARSKGKQGKGKGGGRKRGKGKGKFPAGGGALGATPAAAPAASAARRP